MIRARPYTSPLLKGGKRGLLPKKFDISLGDSPGLADLVGGHVLRPHGPVNRFRIDPQNLRHFGDRQKLAHPWLEQDPVISGERLDMLKLPSPYLFRNLVRKRVTPPGGCATEVYTIVTGRRW